MKRTDIERSASAMGDIEKPSAESSFATRVFPDFLAFALGLGLAWVLQWETTDLIWSLWLCSLVLGYLTLLSGLGATLYATLQERGRQPISGVPPISRMPSILQSLFMLIFFSLHFGGFHAGHSVFLQQFFPLAGVPEDGFGSAFMNPLRLWLFAAQHLMLPYGLFLIPAVVAERHHVFAPLLALQRPPHTRGRIHPLGSTMSRPYINVMRMHMLIFVFALAASLGVEGFPVYAAVYCAYFFPWAELPVRTDRAAARSE